VSADLLPSILGIALVAAAAAFVLLPFARGTHVEATLASDNPTADRSRLYQQVLELEFDRDMGKLSSSDYEQLSAELLSQAGASLRDERGTLGAVDEEIEREIAAARAAFAAARRSSRETESSVR
jgi:cytochrome c-type biogenesis protein CcmI